MVSFASVFTAVALLVASATTVEGHGYMRQPLVAFKGGRTNSAWIKEDKPAWTGFKSWKTYIADFARISKQKGFSTLRSFQENRGAACGFTDPNVSPRAIPKDGKVIYAHNDIGFVHPGPCELWLDGKMILHKDDCQKAFPGKQAVMPVDFSSCKGTCMLRMYWLAFQDQGQRWQTYSTLLKPSLQSMSDACLASEGLFDSMTSCSETLAHLRKSTQKAMATSTPVFLQCTKEYGKLRVRITSPGYFNYANCQFPRSIRSEGQVYYVDPRSVRLVQSASGRNFYRVAQPIRIWDGDDEALQDFLNRKKDQGGKTKKGGRKRQRPVEKPKAVYDHKDEPDCVVCLDDPKEQIFVPCGHFCMCEDCTKQLVHPKKCPICREPIKSMILPSDL